MLWKIDLCQMWLISLMFFPLSSALFTIPYGIQYKSVTEDDLFSKCSPCYEDKYSERTSTYMILSCTGPVLFVGAQKRFWFPWLITPTIYLGAFALASEIHKITVKNTPHESNGVYWYFTPLKSFGFLGDTDLQQNTTADVGTTNPDSRLSWNLDNRMGGYRAGALTEIDNKYTKKIIYNCPNGF